MSGAVVADAEEPALAEAATRRPGVSAVAFLVPLALLAGLVALLLLGNPAALLDNGAPPAEELVFERVELAPGAMTLHVRNGAAADLTIAQVMVDDAYWAFTVEPSPTLGRYEAGVIRLEYPWVEGEAHAIGVVTSTGVVWRHDVPVAVETPAPTPAALRDYALIGLLVGFLPVAVGMAFFPAMRALPGRHLDALLAFTLGLLAFLLVDTVEDGLELAEAAPGAFQPLALFAAAAALAVGLVLGLERALGRRRAGAPVLALLIALGIGLHNLGEGLLIGSAFAVGSLALGSTLILGFAIHNVTEGPAIVSPLARGPRRVAWAWFVGLALLAGLPTVLGAWLGAFATTSLWAVVFFGLGAGAIVVVLVQVAAQVRRDGGRLASARNLAAFGLGYAVMLATALLTA